MTASFLLALLFACGCSAKKPTPEDLINSAARVKGTLPYPVMDWKVLSSSADRNAQSVSTLFGNDVAVAAARSATAWPQGSVLGLVTWHAKEDAHWFGGRIPDAPMLVEFVEVRQDGTGYRKFSGTPLVEGPAGNGSRGAAIAAMQPVRLP